MRQMASHSTNSFLPQQLSLENAFKTHLTPTERRQHEAEGGDNPKYSPWIHEALESS